MARSDQFAEDALGGEFNARDYLSYIEGDASSAERQHVQDWMSDGMSAEWAAISYAHGFTEGIDDIQSATASYEGGSWTLTLDHAEGSTTIGGIESDAFVDLFFDDLYMFLGDNDIDVEIAYS